MEIEGFPNYLIHKDGRVENQISGRILKPGLNHGYLFVVLCPGQVLKKIHRLIAEHYIPNPENNPCVDHINRNKTDNRIENLRWATYLTNAQNRTVKGSIQIINNKYKVQWSPEPNTRKTKTFETKKEAQEFAKLQSDIRHRLGY